MGPNNATTASSQPFLSDIKEIRRRARAHMDQGAVTDGYRADRETVVRLLNESLATEIVCVLRYRRHHYMANGIHATAVAEEFLKHSQEEQGHADQIAELEREVRELRRANDILRTSAAFFAAAELDRRIK